MRPIRLLIAGVSAGLAVFLVAVVIAVIAGVLWRATNGRMRIARRPDASAATDHDLGQAVVTGEQLGQALGERATLLQFSSAFCAPCRATRQILADIAGMTDGVAHVEIDAESRLDLVRELNVLRTPTVLVLAADGRIVRRASGQPRKPDVIAALGEAVRV